MKKNIKYIILSFLMCINLYASGGSIYSRYGLGDFYYSYSARRMGLGELGIASVDYDYINFVNPASVTKLRLTRVETGIIYHGNNISSKTNSVYYSQTIFTGFMLGFPIQRNYGISLTAGLVPFSNVDYDIQNSDSNQTVGSYKISNSGKGGLSKALIGLSYKLPFNFSVGASFDYYFGKITYKTAIEFLNATEFRNGTFADNYSYHGIGFSIGIITNNLAQRLNLNKISDLKIGLTYSSNTILDADTLNSSTTIVGLDTISAGAIQAKLPFKLGVGVSLLWNKDFLFLADYLYQPFQNYTVNSRKINELKNLQKFSIGVEYRKSELKSLSFWEQVIVRGGLSYEKTQYHLNGRDIEMWSIYTGFSLPVGFDSYIDFAFQYGQRGTIESNLLKEKIYKFSVTLSLGELWFVKQER